MNDTARLFIALWLPPDLVLAAAARLDLLKMGGKGIRWARMDQLHLTLKFLGETRPDLLPEIGDALGRVADATPRLSVNLTHGGVFPPAGPPRVIWLGAAPGEPLAALAARVDQALRPLGFTPERRSFQPHLTLGRAEPGASFDKAVLAAPLRTAPGPVDTLTLVRSELKPQGAFYQKIGEWPLQQPEGLL